MKAVVVYKSKSGFVKRYAHWIADELSADLFDRAKVTAEKLREYDIVIYGGGLYAVGINGITLITENMHILKNKKLIVFGTGASSPNEDIIDEIRDKNFSMEQQNYIKFFYLRGGFNYSKLNRINKILMNTMKFRLKSKKQRTSEEIGMLNAYDNPVDFTDKKNIVDLVAYVKSLNG